MSNITIIGVSDGILGRKKAKLTDLRVRGFLFEICGFLFFNTTPFLSLSPYSGIFKEVLLVGPFSF